MNNEIPTSLYNFYKNMFDASNQYIGILDMSSQFSYINKRHAEVIGYKSTEDAVGISYNQFRCHAVEKSTVFKAQDTEVISTSKPLAFLSYHCYHNDDWRLLYGEKSGILNDEKKLINIFSAAQDITMTNLVDVSRFLVQDAKINCRRIKQKAFTYYLSKDKDLFDLSIKEQEVLFYFIRGKTALEISEILFRSKRTIEMHITALKVKFLVETKSQLIEKAIMLGYMAKMPQTLIINHKLDN